tara:strand:- start:3676 stop:3876 length:201 start_codon:yes stop_codon:yes gene_type:complete
MKVGDLVRVVRSEDKQSATPVGLDKVGVIVSSHGNLFHEQDGFAVLLDGRVITFGSDYLRVFHESR